MVPQHDFTYRHNSFSFHSIQYWKLIRPLQLVYLDKYNSWNGMLSAMQITSLSLFVFIFIIYFNSSFSHYMITAPHWKNAIFQVYYGFDFIPVSRFWTNDILVSYSSTLVSERSCKIQKATKIRLPPRKIPRLLKLCPCVSNSVYQSAILLSGKHVSFLAISNGTKYLMMCTHVRYGIINPDHSYICPSSLTLSYLHVVY